VTTKAIVVAGLSAIAIAASGCGGGSDAEAEFRAAFEKEFSAAPWYDHITGIEVTDGSDGRARIRVTTDLPGLPAGGGDDEPDRPLCGAVMNFAVDSGAYDEIPIVGVFGADGGLRGGCA
jgi:hypothetical protein